MTRQAIHEQLRKQERSKSMTATTGSTVQVYPTAAEYATYTGKQARIVRELGDDERDLEEVGRMFTVQFTDGFRLDVFEDEIA